MPISNNQLAAILYFLLAIVLTIALHFMPAFAHSFYVFAEYGVTGMAIGFALLASPPADLHP